MATDIQSINSLPYHSQTNEDEEKSASFFHLSKMPKKRYQFLYELIEKNIPSRYTPFIQAGLAENLSLEWRGSCDILSHTWLIRKARSTDISKPVFYEISLPYLPHPMIVAAQKDEDIFASQSSPKRVIQEILLSQSDQQAEEVYQDLAETRENSVKCLVEHLKKYHAHATVIESHIYYSNFEEQFGHCCAFIKKGDACIWFDPNYGELYFEHFEHFAEWFKNEALFGTQRHLLMMENSEKNESPSLLYFYPIPEISEEEREQQKENLPLLGRIHNKLMKAADERGKQKISMTSRPIAYTYRLKDEPLILPKNVQDEPFL